MVRPSATTPGLRQGAPRLAALLLAGAAALSDGPAAAQEPFLLPDHPPDSVPADLYDNFDRDYAAPMDIFSIIFHAGLSRERKTELVRAVGAVELVGGLPMSLELMDGQYLIRVETDGTIQPLLRAVDTLSDSPDVISVGIVTLVGPAGAVTRAVGTRVEEMEGVARPGSGPGTLSHLNAFLGRAGSEADLVPCHISTHGIHWPDLDEDLSTEGLLRGAAAPGRAEHRLP